MPLTLKEDAVELKTMLFENGKTGERAYANGQPAGPIKVAFEYLTGDMRWDGALSQAPVINKGGKKATIKRVIGPRPTRVEGFIVPTKTSGRGVTPEPCCGVRVDGAKDVNRGHLMALELGGEDSSWNIVPQWGIWQQQDVWRKMETDAKNEALRLLADLKTGVDPKVRLHYKVEIDYPAWKDFAFKPRLQAWGFPVGFRVTIVKYVDNQPDGTPWLHQTFEGSHKAEKLIRAGDLSYLKDYQPTTASGSTSPQNFVDTIDDREPELSDHASDASESGSDAGDDQSDVLVKRRFGDFSDFGDDDPDDPNYLEGAESEQRKMTKTEANSTPPTAQIVDKKTDGIEPEDDG